MTGAVPGAAGGDLGSQVFVKRCVLCHGVDGRGRQHARRCLEAAPRRRSSSS
jgi:cytochrome c